VLVELRRPSLATARVPAARQRAYVSSLGNEVRTLWSALRAKGVALHHAAVFARVWNGFAATIDTADLPTVRAIGLRTDPVRRFYPAGTVVGDSPKWRLGTGRPAVALLDSSGPHGAALSQVLEPLPIRRIPVAALRHDPSTGARTEFGTTDELLAGLERAVDPNGDGDTSDHVPVALVGVHSPYAGFADSPEAVAAGGARALGTLVVAPAGNEGPGSGTVGSPAAAPAALAVGALHGGGNPALPAARVALATSRGRALFDGTLLAGSAHAVRAPVATPAQTTGRVLVAPLRTATAARLPLATRAAAAADAGAIAIVVCEPDGRRPLSAAGGATTAIPVIGLHGPAAARALALTRQDDGIAFISVPERRTARGVLAPARTSSRGPTYALAPKPDLSAPGTALIGSQATLVTGTSVAAARVAGAAVAVRARNPSAGPDDVAAALIGTAQRLGPTLLAGAGELEATAAPQARILIEPASVALPREAAGVPFAISRSVTIANAGATTARVRLTALLRGADVKLVPAQLTLKPHARKPVTVTVAAEGRGNSAGFVTGRISASGAGPPVETVVGLPIGPPPAAHLWPLRLAGRAGVRVTAGAVHEHDDTRDVEPLGRLELQLVDGSGKVVRELTPRGGAFDLLPGEYEYTLTRSARRGLARGRYRFVARGRGPAGGPVVVRKSPSFTPR
jgi:Subtilase family